MCIILFVNSLINFNNAIVNYDDPIAKSGKLTLYDINTTYGNRVYERTAIFILSKAVKEQNKTLMNFDGLLYLMGMPMFVITLGLLLVNFAINAAKFKN